MATVIDAFVVTFGLKPADAAQGRKIRDDYRRTKVEATQTAKEIEARGKQAAQFFGNIKAEVLGLFAVFTAGQGLKSFTRDTINADAATGRLAKNIGVATEELSAWQGVVKRTGGTASDADSSLQSLATALQQINLTGQSPLIPYLQNLGLTLNDLKDPTETLLKIADAMRDMPAPRAMAIGQGLGLSPAMVNVLQKGRVAVQQMLVEQVKLGVITKEDAIAAQRLQDVLSQLGAASADMGRDLLTSAIPALEWLGRLLVQAAGWAKEHGPVITGAFWGLAAAAAALTIALAPEVIIFGAIAVACAALGAAIGFLIDDFQKFQAGGPSSIDWAPFVGGIHDVQGALAGVGAAFKQVGQAAKAAYDAVPPEVWAFLGNSLKALGGLVLNLATFFLNGLAGSLRVVAGVIRMIVALLTGDWAGAWKAAGDIVKTYMDTWAQQWATLKKAVIDYWDAVRGKGKTTPRPAPKPAARPSGAANDNNRNLGTFEGVKNYFKSKGWSESQARGIAAGIGAESQFNANARNPTSGAIGLGQHLGSRKDALLKRWGPNPTAQQQLDFLNWELRGGDRGGASVQRAQTEQEALDAYVRRFMRPAPGGETSGDMQRGRGLLAGNPTGGAALAANASGGGSTNDNRRTVTNETHIGTVVVNTQATDAQGIARDLGPALQKRGLAVQANTGLG